MKPPNIKARSQAFGSSRRRNKTAKPTTRNATGNVSMMSSPRCCVIPPSSQPR
jgi:hypothetical protein